MKEVILTGLRANTDLHIGNYLGALLPMVDMAKNRAGDYQVNLFMPDLHSFTTPVDHNTLHANILNNIKQFVAAGLPIDHDDVYVYRQSYVPAHSELTWILDCFTGFGEMGRMTQFKEKGRSLAKAIAREHSGFVEESNSKDAQVHLSETIADINQRVTVGLFNYPVLMAADILLYNASYVPVGDDQTQHLEFTRNIAERMNNQFAASLSNDGGELFVVPKPVQQQHEFFGKDQGLRIRDLVDPTKKMSKSDETGKGVIFLSDSPQTARNKIMSATTHSFCEVQYDYQERPGISNLLDILKLFGGPDGQQSADEFIGQSQYGPLKAKVADVVAEFLSDFQNKFANVDEAELLRKLESSEAEMNKAANQTLYKVQQAVGLRPRG